MKIKNFKDLLIWQKSHQVTLTIYKLTKSLPEEEKFGLRSQLRRSSALVCANISERYKKKTKEFARFLDISTGSLEETKYHIILCKDLGYISECSYNAIYEQLEEIGKMINGFKTKDSLT